MPSADFLAMNPEFAAAGDATATARPLNAGGRGIGRKRQPTPQKPAQRVTPTEHAEQAALIAWADGLAPRLPALVVTNLPLPPSMNNAYRNTRDRGGRALTKEAKRFKAEVRELIEAEVLTQGFAVPPRTPLRLTFGFWYERNNRDGSNTPKLIEDVVAEVLGFNDIWVWEMRWTKAIDKHNPRCDVTIEVI